jgi:hypothetical protein
MKGWRRIFWHPTVANPLKAFFGYTRPKIAIFWAVMRRRLLPNRIG